MTSIDDLLQNPAFQNIDAEKVELIKKMYDEIQGKNQMEAVSVIMKYAKGFSQGQSIPKEDRDLMISIMLERLPQKEKEMFQKLIVNMTNQKS